VCLPFPKATVGRTANLTDGRRVHLERFVRRGAVHPELAMRLVWIHFERMMLPFTQLKRWDSHVGVASESHANRSPPRERMVKRWFARSKDINDWRSSP
jgi:hypothetical protein